MRLRYWQFMMDVAVLLAKYSNLLYYHAHARLYPPRVGEADFIVRAVMEDNVPSQGWLTDE
jgi:hypothetical protein